MSVDPYNPTLEPDRMTDRPRDVRTLETRIAELRHILHTLPAAKVGTAFHLDRLRALEAACRQLARLETLSPSRN